MKLFGEHRAKQLFHRRQVDPAFGPGCVRCFQSPVVRRPVLLNLLRDRQSAWQQRLKADAENEI